MRRLVTALVALGLLHGCRDFDDALTRCAIDRICTDGQSSAGFSLTLTPNALTLTGPSFSRTRLDLTYPQSYFNTVSFRLDGAADAGLVAIFVPDTAGAFTTEAPTLDVRTAAPSMVTRMWTLDVVATQLDGGEKVRQALTITAVPSTASVLVVDDDHSDNNFNAGNDYGVTRPMPKVSPADEFYAAGLATRGVSFDTWIQPEHAWDGGHGPLTLEQIQRYSAIVWYTDRSFQQYDNITAGDDFALRRWLDLGNKKLVLLSENYVGYQVPTDWDMVQPDKGLAADYIGVLGGADDGAVENGNGFDFSGVAGQTTAGMSLRLPMGTSETNLSLINPKPGTQPLLTVRGDPDGTTERDIAMATVRRNVGDAGTSTAAYVGFALVTVEPTDGGTREGFFKALLDSAVF